MRTCLLVRLTWSAIAHRLKKHTKVGARAIWKHDWSRLLCCLPAQCKQPKRILCNTKILTRMRPIKMVTLSITSIIQRFVYKCNSNSCKLFYLDYKSMLIHKLPQTPYTALPLDWQVWAQENTVYSAFSKFISWWAINLVGKPNTTSPIWNHFHSCHPSTFVQVSSSSNDCKRPAGQVCIGEAFSKLAKYKQDRSKWKMLTRNVTT